MKTRAIVYHAHGAPETVAHLEERELGALGPFEARVRMLFAPINPADLNVIEGTYPLRPSLEAGAVPGGEGVGRVEQTGVEVKGLLPGTLVLLAPGVGSWCEICQTDAASLVPVPDGIPPQQAAMLRVNPATALRMLNDFVDLQPGQWLLQNAANSAVGRAVIQMARLRGIRTLNVVRRPELFDELRGEGAEHVFADDESLPVALEAATGGAPIPLALNCVGGEGALRLAGALAEGGTLVTFGAMSRQPLRIPNGLLIFKDLRWRGFWLTKWYQQASPQARAQMFAELFSLARNGVIHSPVEKIYPLGQIAAALHRAKEGRRSGKILLECASPLAL